MITDIFNFLINNLDSSWEISVSSISMSFILHCENVNTCVPHFDWRILNSKPIRFVISSCQFKGE
jgi:hypothetical protein